VSRRRPLVLLTNDDGVESAGIDAIRRALEPLAEVWVVAPREEQSSCGHAITLARPVFARELGPRRFWVAGSPADAVFIALADILPARPAIDVFYSGTVAAAREAAFRRIPAVAVSMPAGADPGGGGEVVAALVEAILGRRASAGGGPAFFNVNIPAGPARGFRLTRLGRRVYGNHVVKRTSPRGMVYYWIDGGPAKVRRERGTDSHALAHGFVSVTPLRLDHAEEAAGGGAAARLVAALEARWRRGERGRKEESTWTREKG